MRKKDAVEKVKADKNDPEIVITADGYSQLPDAGLLFLCKSWIFSGGPEGEDETVSRHSSS